MVDWRDVVGYEGVYQVSDDGQVKRIKPGKSTRAGRLLKIRVGTRGRCCLDLSKDGVSRSHDVHKLVAEAFLGPRPDGKEINHIDYNCRNNSAGNLEYITRSENIRHAYGHGFQCARGEDQGQAKLTDRDVELIRKSPLGATALARHYGVARGTIRLARDGKTWTHVV